jgi:hypothetical protein
MRVLVLKGQSQYGGTRLFADEAAGAFNRQGHDARVLDLGDGATVEADLAVAAVQGFDLVLSFNILGNFRGETGKTMATMFGCPHVVWHTDYILASWERVQGTPPGTPLLVVDPTQIDAVNATAGLGPHRLQFFPHPAVGQPLPDEPDVEAFVAARPIPVLWSGGFAEPQAPWGSAPPAVQQIMEAAVELAMSVEWMPPHLALAEVFQAVGLDVYDPALRHSLEGAWMVDAAVRTRRRSAFLIALADSGVDLHVCGAGWESHLDRFKTVTYHGAVDMARMVALMRRSRLVLNTNGNFGAGSHERPFSASLAGAAVFSDFSRYYADEFVPEENIALFSWLNLPGAMDSLRALSADPARCWRFARFAKQVTLARHTWDRQVADILQAAGLT